MTIATIILMTSAKIMTISTKFLMTYTNLLTISATLETTSTNFLTNSAGSYRPKRVYVPSETCIRAIRYEPAKWLLALLSASSDDAKRHSGLLELTNIKNKGDLFCNIFGLH